MFLHQESKETEIIRRLTMLTRDYFYYPPCHLVLSVPGTLTTVKTSLLHCFLSVITSLSSAGFIPVTSCISSIHFLVGRPLLLLPSPHASIIPLLPKVSLISQGVKNRNNNK